MIKLKGRHEEISGDSATLEIFDLWVNEDRIEWMTYGHDGDYTVIRLQSGRGLAVEETPEQINEMIEKEERNKCFTSN